MDDDTSLSGSVSRAAAGAPENGGQDPMLVETLKAVADGSSGAVEQEIGAFLKGEGDLLETTRAAVAHGNSTTAISEVAEDLAERFGLSPAIARVIGALVVKLLPGTKKKAAKKKPKKPSASAKTAAKKKAKKKAAAKPKKTEAKPKAKKKTSAKKQSTAKAKAKAKK